MITYIFLATLFVASSGILWYLISQKLPELIAIPDHVITERLHEESAKFHIFLLHVRAFFREENYKKFAIQLTAKLLHRLHIFLMRVDNLVTTLLRRIREKPAEEKVGFVVTPPPLATAVEHENSFSARLGREEVYATPESNRIAHVRAQNLTLTSVPKLRPAVRPPIVAEETAAMRVNARVVRAGREDLPFFEKETLAAHRRTRKK